MTHNEPLEKQLEREIIKRFVAAAKHPVCDQLNGDRIRRTLWRFNQTVLTLNANDLNEAWGIWHSRHRIYRACELSAIADYIAIQINGEQFLHVYHPLDKCEKWFDD